MNIDEIMKMAQNLQNEMQEAQANLDTLEVEGLSGGGLVKVKATAKGRIVSVAIDDSLMTLEEKPVLEDLIAAALNDARVKAESVAGEHMAKSTQGLQLPPGFKMPF